MSDLLKVPTMADFMAQGKQPEVLFWVGCAGSFDDRAKKITKAFVKILNNCGIDFAVLGTEEIEQVQQAVIMPNPSNGVASLQFELMNASDVTVTVLDVAGKEVQNTTLNQLTSGTHNVALESAKWNSGVYFVNIASNGTVLTKKFVKK